MKKVGLKKFSESVLRTWLIVYDGDPDKAYGTDNFDKVLAFVESSVRGYIGDDYPSFDLIIDNLITKVRGCQDLPVIPLRINNLAILIYKIEIDKTHDIHKLLCECYDNVDEDLQDRIRDIFKS